MCSGVAVRATTRMPEVCCEARSANGVEHLPVHQLVPAVDDGLDALEPERDSDVPGDRVGVDEQDLLALAELEARRPGSWRSSSSRRRPSG
jgi:hypothetical protein